MNVKGKWLLENHRKFCKFYHISFFISYLHFPLFYLPAFFSFSDSSCCSSSSFLSSILLPVLLSSFIHLPPLSFCTFLFLFHSSFLSFVFFIFFFIFFFFIFFFFVFFSFFFFLLFILGIWEIGIASFFSLFTEDLKRK